MTRHTEDLHPGPTDRGMPAAGGAPQRRDRNLRISRRLTRSLVAASAALVLGFSVLAATTTTGVLNGTKLTSGTASQSEAAATTTDDDAGHDTTRSDADTNSTGHNGSSSRSRSSNAPSATHSSPKVTSGAS